MIQYRFGVRLRRSLKERSGEDRAPEPTAKTAREVEEKAANYRASQQAPEQLHNLVLPREDYVNDRYSHHCVFGALLLVRGLL